MAGLGSKPGERRGGRKKGIPNKLTLTRAAEIAASGLTPLDYMLSVLRDDSAPVARRDEMAKAAAPYCHNRLASIEHSGKDGGPIEVARVERVIVDPAHTDSPGLSPVIEGETV